MTLFLDTNIILDFLTGRTPFADDALAIFIARDENILHLCTSSISIVNAVYILKTRYKYPSAPEKVEFITREMKLLPTSQQAIRKSFASAFADFEDAVQHFTALEHGEIDFIITRDAKGFAKSEIPVLSPRSFVARHLTNGGS